MVIKKCFTIFIVFCLVSSSILYSCPKECPQCWQQFKSSTTTIILPVEKADDNTHLISLKNLRTELEKARIGDRLIVELKLGKEKAIKIGTFFPLVIRSETKILEKYNSMGKLSLQIPKDMKVMPTSGLLIVRDVSGKFNSSKLVQFEIAP